MDNSSRNIDQHLLKAYRETIYQVFEPSIALKIDTINPVLNQFLQENDVTTWAFITAWNPKSQVLSYKENTQRHQELIQIVEKAAYPYFIGKGIGKDSNWEPEWSLFILNISKTEAIKLGKYFDQNAIVFGIQNEAPQLLLL